MKMHRDINRFPGLALSTVLLPLRLMGCAPPVDEDERLAGIITDPDVTTFEYDSDYHAPHVLFPGMGDHSLDPIYLIFHGIPNQEELLQPFTVETGLTGIVDIQNVANYGGDLDTGYSLSADPWVTEACVGDPGHAAWGPYVIDLSLEDTGDPPAWEKKPDFFIPVPYSPQVLNHLEMHATAHDDTNANKKPGVIALTPQMKLSGATTVFSDGVIPAGRFAYVTTHGGGIAVLDTSPANPDSSSPAKKAGAESFQQSAQIDVALIADADSKLDLYVGRGDGTLESKEVRDTGSSYLPRAICAADFDLAVVVANRQDDRVTVVTGAGNGSFDGAHHVTVGDGPVDLAVADFSVSDSADDLAVLNKNARTVTILQGDYEEDENGYVVFNRSPLIPENPEDAKCNPVGEDGCVAYYTTIWRAKYEVISGQPALTNFTQLTDLYENDPDGYRNSDWGGDKEIELAGDADPEIDPLGRWIAFNRHTEDFEGVPHGEGTEVDIVDTDLFVIPLDATGPDPDQEDDITGADDIVVDCEESGLEDCTILADRIPAWAPGATADPYSSKIAFTSQSNDPRHDYDLSIVVVEESGGHLAQTSRDKLYYQDEPVEEGNRDTSPFWFPNWTGMSDDPALIFDRSALSGGEQALFDHQLKRY